MTKLNYLDLTDEDLEDLETCYFQAARVLASNALGTAPPEGPELTDRRDYVDAFGAVAFALSVETHIAESADWEGPDHSVFGDHIGYLRECEHLYVRTENPYLADEHWVEETYLSIITHHWTEIDEIAQEVAGAGPLSDMP